MDVLGIGVIVAVLVVATTIGLWRRRTDGMIRDEAADKRKRAGLLAAAGLEVVELPDRKSPSANAATAAKAASGAAAAAFHGGVGVGGAASKTADGRPGVVPDAREEPGVVEENSPDASTVGESLDQGLLDRLGVGPAPVTLLQFSSAFCAPCRAVRRVSTEVAALLPGVQHVEVDAESHLAEVRELNIWRTPTLLIVDAGGHVVKRATGVPSKPQLIAAVADLLPEA
ncbi:TlpA family protein disulfide reductase [Paractinoplanes toevensis]|uniref:Thioredoxin domain-containing protein n=1 Tax=Paractinoplanes toevensis TaxID=571911 RepID=A0A919TI38_9ACTN|nr:thioredoxin family protein [Actinoplanes toevensis]GIM94469.1 hypothetical protein Ato02nite_062620 [Actinoplanes toevensis]